MIINQLEKINRFTRRELSADEVYIFSVILCDNDIDRDLERFSDSALNELKSLFIGKTGIFDHNMSSANQTARIFDTELCEDSSRTSKNGGAYRYLKAYAYMVKTDDNRTLIAEIDGGIKKEVSISCSAAKRLCSVCGCDKAVSSCAHVKGKSYGGRLCHTVLDSVTDAYEWSFVAVPAQVNAGVTKHFSSDEKSFVSSPAESCPDYSDEELLADIRRLAFFSGDNISSSPETMNTAQLIQLKKSLELKTQGLETEIQLLCGSHECSHSEFSMK